MEQISTMLFGLFRGTPRHDEWVVACLSGMWSGLLGERMARACRPKGLCDSSLTIEILDSSWEGALKSMESDLLLRIGAATGNEVRTIVFESSLG